MAEYALNTRLVKSRFLQEKQLIEHLVCAEILWVPNNQKLCLLASSALAMPFVQRKARELRAGALTGSRSHSQELARTNVNVTP